MELARSEVLVVGAGPAGLALAVALRQHGMAVRVIDRAEAAKRQPRAAVVWPGEAAILDRLGVLPAFQARAVSLREARVRAFGASLGALQLDVGEGEQRLPMVIEQHDTEALLLARLRALGGEVEWATELIGFDTSGPSVRARVRSARGERDLQADWIVGADGAHSRVREIAGIGFPGTPRENLQCLQINATPQWRHGLPRDHGWYFLKPNASLGVFPLPGGGCRFFCFRTDNQPDRTDPPTVEEMRDLVAWAADAPETQLHPTEPLWLNRARFTDRVAESLVRGRVLLAGDAAHAWSAVGGHGMNVALQDAFALGWRIAAVQRDLASPELLEVYSQEQRARAFQVIDDIHMDVLEQPPSPRWLPLLAAGLVPALALRPLHRLLMRRIGDVDVRHARSDLAVGPFGGRRVHAPAAQDTGWELSAPRAHGAALMEAVAGFRLKVTAEAVPGGRRAMLIRPDGYVGWSGHADQPEPFRRWLQRWFAPA